MSLYVAGPSTRPTAPGRPKSIGSVELRAIYDHVRHELRGFADVRAPDEFDDLMGLGPNAFSEELRSRIERADALITLLHGDDEGIPAESGWAAAKGKPQVILHAPDRTVSRFVEGLPAVRKVIRVAKMDDVTRAVEEIRGDLGRTTTASSGRL